MRRTEDPCRKGEFFVEDGLSVLGAQELDVENLCRYEESSQKS
jgi:hypothetical protein